MNKNFERKVQIKAPGVCLSTQSIHFLLFLALAGILLQACNNTSKPSGDTDGTHPRIQAFLYLQQGKSDEAEASFLKAIEVAPNDVSNYRDLALLYVAEKDLAAAEKQVEAGLKIAADDPELKLILAKIYYSKNENDKAMQELRGVLERDPKNIRASYLMVLLQPPSADPNYKKTVLNNIVALAPANIVLRLELAELYSNEGNTDSSLYQLESVKRVAPVFAVAAGKAYNEAISFLHANLPAKALVYIQQFHKLMKTTSDYANGSEEIEWPSSQAGYATFTTSLYSHQYDNSRKGTLENMKFEEVAQSVGLLNKEDLKARATVLATADYNATGDMYVYMSFLAPGTNTSQFHLFVSNTGPFRESDARSEIEHTGEDVDAAFADYDNDGYQDLFILTTKGILIYNNQGDEGFSLIPEDVQLKNITDGQKMMFVDLDQDGDLDVYIACKGANRFLRNNGDGTFDEMANKIGLSGGDNNTTKLGFADWDADGDEDVFALNDPAGIQLFNNNRHSGFVDITAAAGLQNLSVKGTALTIGDYNNDGLFDIFVAGGTNGECFLLKNSGKTGFVVDSISNRLSRSLKDVKVNDASFWDFDNDGHLDLLVAGDSGNGHGVKLFHNDTLKGFTDVSYLLPPAIVQGQHIEIADFNVDGDDDVFLSGASGIQLLRNDGGNNNHFVQIQLLGVSYGNSKNNRLGIGAQVEVKAGDLYQVKTVTRSMINFGIGMRDSVDAVRIIWPNGLPQIIADPSRIERLVEELKLKGSCPFLFTWNGEKYEFIKDMMWRSALGMPLAIHGKDTTYSFSDASKEYLLIPGEKLKPRNGLYSIKITEELWEAVYFDKASLFAVDHPDSMNIYVDERFVLPPFPGRKVYAVTHENLPVSAVDGKGNDLLSKISSYDFSYISNFSLSPFQGVAEDHDLILNLGDKAHDQDSLLLFLKGWVFPTDASINTALTQTGKYKVHPPFLQVINKKGEWETVIDNLGYPMGKDKMVIANLSNKFLTANDRRVRIRTNMQIYWDYIFFTIGKVDDLLNVHNLPIHQAGLNFRGYSAYYNKGGPFGPQWFDYDKRTTGQQWRDLTGSYTRYGDVMPLLLDADDRYIIANSGDEISIDFDGKKLPPLKKGWKRDFLIYSEGWVKDGDLNTACGQTVEPLPFHNMPHYPYYGKTRYPDNKVLLEYRKKYNTRKVNTNRFVDALKVNTKAQLAKGTSQ